MKRLIVLATALGLFVGMMAAPASAKRTYDPYDAGYATPGQTCTAIDRMLDYAVDIGFAESNDFHKGECASMLSKKDFTFDFFGTPVGENCDFLEGVLGGWPYTFYELEPFDPANPLETNPLPRLTARNDAECARALYAFHTIAQILGF